MWIRDPVSGKPSVTLTLTVVTFIACLVAAGLEMAEVVKSTSLVLELFLGNIALYLGRRWTSGSKVVEGEAKNEQS